MNCEEWSAISGYEGLYSISSFGRVKAHEKIKMSGRKYTTKRIYPEKILKTSPSPRGYLIATFCKKGKTRWFTVHRLVALAFIENPKNKPTVNHIDGNKTNNEISNLEWSTHSEQQLHSIKIGTYNTKRCLLTGKFIKGEK